MTVKELIIKLLEYPMDSVITNTMKVELVEPKIEGIPKDYYYDTETEDFYCYRHKYTGREIHIEKPTPQYRLTNINVGYIIPKED